MVLDIQKIYTLRGPNVWSRSSVLEAWVDLGELKDSPSDSLPGFNERLMAWLPTMIEHRCSIGERGGFFERLRRGTYMAHILEHVSLELQTLAGSDVGFGRARETNVDGIYKVAIKFEEEQLARACLVEARELILAAVDDRPYDVSTAVKRLKDLANLVCFGPSTGALVRAARSRSIPVRRLDAGSLVQLGHGARQHRIRMAETDRTSAIAEAIAQDKEVTKSLLRAVGVPVPEGRLVESPEDAVSAATEVGLPVVVKPSNANHGRGVTINLSQPELIRQAFAFAQPEGDGVLVEQFAQGAEHRVLVVGGRAIAASRGEPEQVVGDGRLTIRQLIDQLNEDPRRGEDWASPLCVVVLDFAAEAILAKQGYTPDSIPPAGTTVLIHHNGELLTDVTDDMHPDVASQCVLAARVVGLDIAGIDLICRDIGQPLRAQGGMIIEVNAGPGLRMHLEPLYGKPRPVAEAIIDTLFPSGATGRIPIAAVTGTNGKTMIVQLLTHLLRPTGRTIGQTSSEGAFVGEIQLFSGECTGRASAEAVLLHPDVDVAVFEAARGGILRSGLGFDQCDVAIVTNIGEPDRLGDHDIESDERMAFVKRSVVDVTVPSTGVAVLNAHDPLVAAMKQYSRGSTIYFATDATLPAIVEHRAAGERAVLEIDGQIILATGGEEQPLLSLARVPITHSGQVRFQVENVLAAAAAAWALKLPLDTIRYGLESFTGDVAATLGRFNVIPRPGEVTWLLDHCHNVAALTALIEAIPVVPHATRSIVYSALGDRRDVDIRRQGKMLAQHFDRVVLYDPDEDHDRPSGEIRRLLAEGLSHGDRVQQVEQVETPEQALAWIEQHSRPRDLVVIQTGVADSMLPAVRGRLKD